MTSAAIISHGTIIKRGDGATPTEAFVSIAEIVDFSGPSGSASVIDVTHLGSTARDKLISLRDEGQFTMNLNFIADDMQQQGLISDRNNRTPRNFKVLFPGGDTVASFTAFVLSFSIAGAKDSAVTASVTLEITGAVTWVY